MELIFALWRGRLRGSAGMPLLLQDLMEGSLAGARELANEPDPRTLLHGDLHPRNVLHRGEGRPLAAIDQRACVGDPALDLIDWALFGVDDKRTLIRRSEYLACRAALAPMTLLRWCACTAVLFAANRFVRGNGLDTGTRFLLALAAEDVRPG